MNLFLVVQRPSRGGMLLCFEGDGKNKKSVFFLERAPFFVPPTQLQRSSQFFCVDVPLHTSVPLSCAATAVVPKKEKST